jgi:short-subunit dehydrogenase
MNDQIAGPALIVGATSPIAQAYAALCAKKGRPLILAGRDAEELAQIAADLRIRHGSQVEVVFYDASEPNAGRVLADVATARGVSSVVTFQGVMVGREGLEVMMRTNCTAVAELFEAVIDDALADGRKPVLAAVSSVAGDRGRQSNYPYGATKAALDAYLSGLRNLHSPAGLRVIAIKPGFVRTPLSTGKVNPRSPLLAEPHQVARDIFRAVEGGGDVVYSPWFWRPIMAIIRALPEGVFKRLRL